MRGPDLVGGHCIILVTSSSLSSGPDNLGLPRLQPLLVNKTHLGPLLLQPRPNQLPPGLPRPPSTWPHLLLPRAEWLKLAADGGQKISKVSVCRIGVPQVQ